MIETHDSIPSGIAALDKITSGWKKSNLILIGGTIAMGKSSLMVSMLNNIAIKQDVPTAVFSSQLPARELMRRLIVNVCDVEWKRPLVPLDIWKNPNIYDQWITEKELEQQKEIDKLEVEFAIYNVGNFIIDDTPNICVFDLKDRARKYVKDNGVKIIFIDYLQLLNAQVDCNGSELQKCGFIVQQLKELAIELNVPIVLMSDLYEKSKKSKRVMKPKMANIYNLGIKKSSIDVICLLHRPEYYRIFKDHSGKDLHGLGQILVLKNHNNTIGNAWVQFNRKHLRFEDLPD